MTNPQSVRNRLLAMMAVLLAIASLRWSYPVTMPLAAAVFIIAAAWPIKPWLDRALPSGLSYLGTMAILLLILAAFAGAVYFSAFQVVRSLAVRQDQFRDLYGGYEAWANAHGLPMPEGGGFGRLVGFVRLALGFLYSVLGYLGFIAVLELPEVPALRRKIQDQLRHADHQETFDPVERIAGVFRSYIGVTVLVSLLTGLASAAWAFALGLELALTWGVLNFLLNFIPVFGNVIGVIPPTLYAMVQFEGWTMSALTFLGCTILQMVISNLIYPWMQGDRVSLPPVVIVLSLAFWGWVWGVAGALLAVPLTAALVIAGSHFRATEWIARLLSKG